MERENQVFEFWRRCLLDESLRQEPQDILMDVSRTDVMDRLRDDWTRNVFKEVPADVLALPVGISMPIFESRSRPRARTGFAGIEQAVATVWCPFHIPAMLGRDGRFSPHPRAIPWFSRQYLDPQPEGTSNETPVVADLMAVAEQLHDLSDLDRGSWSAWLNGAIERFCEIVFGMSSVPDQPFGGHRTGDGVTFVVTSRAKLFRLTEKGKPQEALLDLYAEIERSVEGDPSKRLPGSLMRLAGASRSDANLEPRLPTSSNDPVDDQAGAMPVHVTPMPMITALMSAKGGLDADQRLAVAKAMALPDHDILSVEGPPGTGKTTVIGSLVATSWMMSALETDPRDIEAAPLSCMITSTNNRALINAAESMVFPPEKRWGTRVATISSRWLPDIKGYALMLPAKHRADDPVYQQFDVARRIVPNWQGDLTRIFSPHYRDRAEAAWLAGYGNAFPQAPAATLSDALAILHATLSDIVSFTRSLQLAARVLEGGGPHVRPVVVRRMTATERNIVLNDIRMNIERFGIFDHLRAVWATDRSEIIAKGMILPAVFDDVRNMVKEEPKDGRFDAVEADEALQAIAEWFGDPMRQDMEDGLARAPESVTQMIDMTFGRLLFWLTGRFWEGMWLQRMKSISGPQMARLLNINAPADSQIPQARIYLWSMIWPCMVATFHMAPKVLSWSTSRRTCIAGGPKAQWRDVSLLEICDTLIVDEAGQAAISVAAPVFALAKRAVVIGDRHQIRPVSHLDSGVVWRHAAEVFGAAETDDMLNVPLTEGGDPEYGKLSALPLMHTVTSNGVDVLLRRHRRCVPAIIAFCNDLVYDGALIPVREDIENRLLPAWSFGHVDGQAHRTGGSWSNPEEAAAIARWLAGRADAIRTRYGVPTLGQAVAIVTPYAAQAAQISREIAASGLGKVAADITVGTVHAVQGGEWPIVIFSPARTAASKTDRLFFNNDPSMFNVLVSRARDSIVMIGDTLLFRQMGEQTPGGRFAQRLFGEGEALSDVGCRFITSDEVTRLATHVECRRTLVSILEKARKSVLIVSPYLSDRALMEEVLLPSEHEGPDHRIRILDAVNAAVGRGVDVVVVSDDMLNCMTSSSSEWKPSAEAARVALTAAGAAVWVVSGMHNKTMTMDDDWIAEGSYNWLSAVAEEESRFHRHEAVMCYAGDGAGKMVAAAWSEAEARRLAADETCKILAG